MSKENVESIYPLSPMQEGMLFHSLTEQGSTAYFEQYQCTYIGDFDVAAFQQSWARTIERHPILRTLVMWKRKDKSLQVVRKQVQAAWTVEDWRGVGADAVDSKLAAFLRDDRTRGFDLTQAPLMRFALLRLTDRAYRFVWSFHHLLLDGWSGALLFNEVYAWYQASRTGKAPSLKRVRPYRDYIGWLQQQDMAKAEAFWRENLKGFSAATPLYVGRGAAPGARSAYAHDSARLSEATTATLKALARSKQLTLNTVVQGAWALLLSRYSGEDDVVFGTTVSGRPPGLDGVEDMIGLFINTLPVRVRLPVDDGIVPWLQALQAQQVQLREYEHSPLYRVQHWSDVQRGQPLFESIVVFENYPTVSAPSGDRGFEIKDVATHEETNFPLTLGAEPSDSLLLRLTYDTSRFDAPTIRRMLGHLATVLERIAADPQQRLRDVDIVTDAERKQLLVEWNATRADVPVGVCAHQAFAAQARARPEAVAVVAPDGQLSYGELNRKSDELARYLAAHGVGPDVVVGVCLERSTHLIVAVLGILKAGGAYLPMDPKHPPDRMLFMLQDAQAPIVLTQQSLADGLSGYGGRCVRLDRDWDDIARPLPSAALSAVTPQHLAYVIYTSGSTGKPKGVAVPHVGLMNLVTWHQRAYGVAPSDRATMLAGLAFDASVWELWPYITAGAAIYLADEDVRLSPSKIVAWFAAQKITISFLPTPLAEAVLSEPMPAGLALKYLLTGGDKLHGAPAPGLPFRLYNHYGPTENTVVTTVAEIPPGINGPPTIGRPIANTKVYVLDKYGRPTPIGIPGELYVGGVGLARGYINRPELNETAFLPDPFDTGGARMYRTGDLVRYGADGNIEFLGRIDDQVKIHGYRIELGEIESVLSQHEGVKDAVVIVREDVPGEKKLVAYVVPEHGAAVDPNAFRAYLKAKLPIYMVPTFLVPMQALPLTANGKVDRRALPAPDPAQRTRTEAPVAPASEVEKSLAAIFADVLHVANVGVHDNFFELGGDSILSIQVVARAHQANLQLTPKDIFQHPTIAELAPLAGRARQSTAEQGAVTGPVPLTPIQTWFFERKLPVPAHWNQAYLLEVAADTDVALLEQALTKLIEHHDALRMRYEAGADGWRQIATADSAAPAFARIDLAQVPAAQRASAIEAQASALQAGLSLERGKLVQAAHFDLGQGTAGRLLIAIHHLVVDGVSWRILLEDLEQAYRQLKQGAAVALASKTASFKQWSEALAAYADSATLARELAHWTEACDAHCVAIPTDYTDSAGNAKASARTHSVRLDRSDTQALLQQVPSVYNTQINDVLLTALAQTLTQWTERAGMVIDLEGHGREDVGANLDTSRTVGWFTSLFPVKLTIDTAEPGRALCAVKEQLRRIPGRGIGYGVLRYLSRDPAIRAGLAQAPRREILFNYLGQFDPMLSRSDLFRPAPESSGQSEDPSGMRSHLLEINALVVDGELRVEWTYSEAVHRRASIVKLADGYLKHLRRLLGHCLSPEAGGFTPSDFPHARVDAPQLDELYATWGRNIEDVFPLTSLQQGMLYHTLAAPESGISLEQYTFRLRGEFNQTAFESAWQAVVDRHPALRSAFVWEGLSEPHQLVLRQVPLAWTHEDWRGLAEREREQRLKSYQDSDRAKGFDLARAPLLRMALLRIEESVWYFVWSFHHILIDGWSMGLVLNEVMALYRATSEGRDPALPRPRPYRAYIDWLSRQDLAAAESYWRKSLAGFTEPSSLRLSRADIASGIASNSNAEQKLELPATTTNALQMLARQAGVTLNTVIQGAWAVLLSSYSGRDDIVFGATVAGRPAVVAGIENMAGMFINNLPVRVRIDPEQPLAAWLRQIQAQQVEAQNYEFTPLAKIQEWSAAPRNRPLFESLFVFENYPLDELPREGQKLCVEHLDLKEKTSYAINLIAIPGRELKLFITHDPMVYGSAVVGRMLEHMKNALAAMADPATRNVGDVALMGAAERARMLNEQNAAQAAPGADPVFRFLERRAATAPDDIALLVGAERVTYQQLNRRANQLADHLAAGGARPGTVVGVCLDLSAALLEALFGILKTGATCLLLDPRDPPGRRDYAMKDAGASLLVTHSTLSAATPPDLVRIDIDGAHEAIARRSEQDPSLTLVEDEPAVICYVPTGHGGPVGVQLSHRAIVSALSGVTSASALAPTDTHAVPSVQVVARSVFAMLLPMIAGARLVLPPPEQPVDDAAWAALLASSAATVLSATPQRLRRMSAAGWIPQAGIKILCAGELLSAEQARELSGRGADVYTLYGMEEAGAWSACHRLAAADEYRIIGRALPHAAIYVLDRRLHPVPAGVVGEIYVGGAGLADGYLNQPRLTDARFLSGPAADLRGPLFRTGDLGSYRDDGAIEFVGRHDSRIVIDGVRIEPEEMIARIREHEAVERAAVLVHEQPSGEPRLTAYFSRRPEREVSITDIRKHVRRHVRSDTVLLDVVELEHFPLAAGGMIDYAALRAAVAPGNGNGAGRAAPGSDSEQKIAAIWKATLGVERVGTNDNFFELGGNSLLAMQVIAGIEAATGTRISARALLMNTLQQIAALCVAPAPTTPTAGARSWRDRIRSVLPIPGRSPD